MTSPEELADLFVSLADSGPGGRPYVLLALPGGTPVRLRPHANPGIVRGEVAAVRRFIASAIRAGRAGAPTNDPVARRSGADE